MLSGQTNEASGSASITMDLREKERSSRETGLMSEKMKKMSSEKSSVGVLDTLREKHLVLSDRSTDLKQ